MTGSARLTSDAAARGKTCCSGTSGRSFGWIRPSGRDGGRRPSDPRPKGGGARRRIVGDDRVCPPGDGRRDGKELLAEPPRWGEDWRRAPAHWPAAGEGARPGLGGGRRAGLGVRRAGGALDGGGRSAGGCAKGYRRWAPGGGPQGRRPGPGEVDGAACRPAAGRCLPTCRGAAEGARPFLGDRLIIRRRPAQASPMLRSALCFARAFRVCSLTVVDISRERMRRSATHALSGWALRDKATSPPRALSPPPLRALKA